MGNSIEEDIKILEEFIDELKQYNPKTGKDINPTQFGEGQRYVYSNVYYSINNILSDYKRVLKENEELKEYIMLAPNLDEMTAIKYSNIQKEAYIRGRAEEQKKAKQIIYENYIPVQKVKDKIEEELPLTIVGGRRSKKTLE